MRIFLSFLQSNIRHPVPSYSFWQHYIKNGILEAGHSWDEVPDVDWAFGIVPKSIPEQDSWKEMVWGQTISYLEKHPADIFLSYLYPGQIDVSAINHIKKMGIPCVNFFCDNVREFKKAPGEFGIFDLNWVPEYNGVELYKKAGFPHINLPMPVWVDPVLRIVSAECNRQITFIGSKDIQRLLFFEESLRKNPGLPLALYGAGWDEDAAFELPPAANYTFTKKVQFQYKLLKEKGISAYVRKLSQRNIPIVVSEALKARAHGTINFETYNKCIAESMITLGVNRDPSYLFPIDKPGSYSRLRDIEAPMLGACYLTEYAEGLETMYDFGADIEVYQNVDDFNEKCDRLGGDTRKRKKLRLNGQKRALNDHSIPASLNTLFKKLH